MCFILLTVCVCEWLLLGCLSPPADRLRGLRGLSGSTLYRLSLCSVLCGPFPPLPSAQVQTIEYRFQQPHINIVNTFQTHYWSNTVHDWRGLITVAIIIGVNLIGFPVPAHLPNMKMTW